ncbi:hypothetical protein KFZ70_03980 [Tamlana fucoidanivorans]|uniref:Uncharacterized protein n=1 Tax=Allotamlana fucoidanivorans TaxID=2583814 RepID=A0A5C4SKR2_9FLAO|nr:DUF6428 family protein [Tamlana fucoidanivorans]TNJ44148.1 hypothetical protein FGF67_08940 [Tamlana fucoidanivorans]
MKTQDFFEVLEAHKNKALLFEYAPKKLVGANYHITEVKHVGIDAVDCGAQMDSWNETVVQLWESPSELNKTEFMGVYKALGIFKKVGTMKPYDLHSEIKFEYGNSQFHTAQLFVNNFEIHGDRLIVKLAAEKTDCKAKSTCGLPEEVEIVDASACCSPESGCC